MFRARPVEPGSSSYIASSDVGVWRNLMILDRRLGEAVDEFGDSCREPPSSGRVGR